MRRRLSSHPPVKVVIIYRVYGSHKQYNYETAIQFSWVRVLLAHSRVFLQLPHSCRVGHPEVHMLRSCHNALRFWGCVGRGWGSGCSGVQVWSGSPFPGRMGLEGCHCHRQPAWGRSMSVPIGLTAGLSGAWSEGLGAVP